MTAINRNSRSHSHLRLIIFNGLIPRRQKDHQHDALRADINAHRKKKKKEKSAAGETKLTRVHTIDIYAHLRTMRVYVAEVQVSMPPRFFLFKYRTPARASAFD